MGLLDEAIREHLELKRRHGADAGEIARLEQEALGPARRTPADAPPPEAPATEPELAAGAADEKELFYDEPAAAATEAPTTVHAPAVDDEYEYVYEDEGDVEDVEPGAEVPPSADAPQEPIRAAQQPTAEFEPASEEEWADDWDEPGEDPEPNVPPAAEASETAEEGEKSEDVLEETPEFLQETPEHDRLWFEQKPPRDFDF
jgi:hypothetical protein